MQRDAKIDFHAGDARVSVDLAAGGRISELHIGDQSLLVPRADDPVAWGCYPMAPWAGRVRDGRFRFEGREFTLPRTMPPHAIHGTTFDRPWQQVEVGTWTCALGPDWPWRGTAIQMIDLREDALSLRLEVHAEDEPFPATVGWHPWFVRRLENAEPARLIFDAEAMYACDASGIPTGKLVPVPEGPWDDCFVGVATAPELDWAGALRLRLDSSADHWVVYSEPKHALCIEPMTGPPNALNSGARTVRPGEPLVATLRLSWQRSD